MPTIVDINDYGVVGDGVANDRAAILAMSAANVGGDISLIGTGGKTFYIGSRASPSDADEDYLFSGISKLTVVDEGDWTLTDGGDGNDFHIGARHTFYEDDSHHARVRTVAAGAYTVELITDADHTMFTVGDWACMQGYLFQFGGFPQNVAFFEYVKIASKQTSVSPYTVTFETPLRKSYREDWPDWGSAYTLNGPACLYAMHPLFDSVYDFRGLIVDRTNSSITPTNCGGRDVTFRRCSATNSAGINPSAHISLLHEDCDWSGVHFEVDKLVETFTMTGCTYTVLSFQSSCIDNFVMDNCTCTKDGGLPGDIDIVAGARTTRITNSSAANISAGAFLFGAAYELSIDDSPIGIVGPGGNTYRGPGNAGVDTGSNDMVDGVIIIPKSDPGLTAWAVPSSNDGYCMFYDDERTCIKMFRVLGVTESGGNILIQTDLAGESWPANHGAHLAIRSHPAPKHNRPGYPANAPLYSYYTGTFDGTSATSGGGDYLWGNLVTATFDVTVATASAKSFNPLGDFCWMTLSDGSLSPYPGYVPVINFNTQATRVITEAGNTGIQTGDSGYDPPEYPAWFANKIFGQPVGGDLVGGTQSITTTVQTDQGVITARTFTCNFA